MDDSASLPNRLDERRTGISGALIISIICSIDWGAIGAVLLKNGE
jgi:hypothetical protein